VLEIKDLFDGQLKLVLRKHFLSKLAEFKGCRHLFLLIIQLFDPLFMLFLSCLTRTKHDDFLDLLILQNFFGESLAKPAACDNEAVSFSSFN